MHSVLISAFVIVNNEEKNIERCLNSVRWADEIVIVDSASTDRTVEICRRYTDKIFSRTFTNYSEQKNFALSKTSGAWALSIDADEEITAQLAQEIKMLLESNPPHDAYRIRRTSYIFSRRFQFSGTQDDKPIRLFRSGKVRFTQPIHEIVQVGGSVGELKAKMNHYTYPDTASYWNRFERYTSMEAEFLAAKQAPASFIDQLLRPPAMFLKLYVAKQGFRDGYQGFLFCLYSSWYVFVKYAKYLKWRKKTVNS